MSNLKSYLLNTLNRRGAEWFQRENLFGGAPARRFSNSEPVREWLVLRALESFAKGDYESDPREIDDAYQRMVLALKYGTLVLDYAPTNGYMLDIPAIGHPMYLQAMVYWSVHMDCTLAELSEVHAALGPRPSLRDAHAAMSRLQQRRQGRRHRPSRALNQRTKSPETLPVFARTSPFIAPP